MFYLFQSDRTIDKKVLVFCNVHDFCNTSGFWIMTSLRAAITLKRRLGHPSRLYFLNPGCKMIPWVAALEIFQLKTFGDRAFYPIDHSFANLCVTTIAIASFKCYTPKFSASPQELTWCQRFGVQVLPKSGNSASCTQR